MITDTRMALTFPMSSILVVFNACLALRLERSLRCQELLSLNLELLSSRPDKKEAVITQAQDGDHLV